MSQLNLSLYSTKATKKWKNRKKSLKNGYAQTIRGVSLEEEKEVYDGKD